MERADILINKFLNQQLSSVEKNELLNWLKQNKDNQNYLKQLESLYHAAGIISAKNHFNSEQAFNQFRQKINAEKASRKTKLRYLLVGAASVAASIIITVLVTYSLVLDNQHVSPQVSEISKDLEIKTAKGSRTSLTLADGTKIWLNSNSRLVYPDNFKGSTREVFLEGEGYFEVAKNPQKPFYVKTDAIDVKVTGTIFNLQNYPDERFVETTLIEGQVIIERSFGDVRKEIVTLEPKQKIIFQKSNETYELSESVKEEEPDKEKPIQKIEKAVLVEKANIEKTISWKNNVIIFENEPFHEIVNSLERRFGVNIVFQSESIKNLRFSGTFEEISIEQALEAMQFASPFNYKIEKDTIYIINKK